MTRMTFFTAFFLALFLGVSATFGCLWDSDTLQMERLRFPGVLEIITGKFVRHSQAYYEWRIGDRKKKLESNPDDPALIDDLAVACAKLGRPEGGIPLLEKVLESHPGRYETLSNLGTLLFFAGRLDESKAYIRRALEINPDAHFGRERYQWLLTEYLQQSGRQTSGVMCTKERYQLVAPLGFAAFVLNTKFPASDEPADDRRISYSLSREEMLEIRNATRGVLGMMHFADYQSPILLESLGDLLMCGPLDQNNTQLAARAYLQAAQFASNAIAAENYRQMADQVLADHIDYEKLRDGKSVAKLEGDLAKELDAANAWFAAIEADEKQWIAANRNVDQEFARKYYDSLEKTISAADRAVKSEPRDTRLTMDQKITRGVIIAAALTIGIPLALLASLVALYIRIRTRRQAAANVPAVTKSIHA